MQKSFNEFYQAVRPTLEQLEKERRVALSRSAWAVGIAVVAGLLVTLGIFLVNPDNDPSGAIFALLFFAVAGYGYAEWRHLGPFRRRFKLEVIERLVKFVSSELHYDPSAGVGERAYRDSLLFPRSHDRFRQEDLIAGTVGQTRLRVSEIHSEYRTRDSKGRTNWHTIFRGLFFVLDFPKRFNGTTLVLPDGTGWLGGLGDAMQGWDSRGELVKLEDPEFERLFVVQGTDQVEARYLLSTSMMERIKELRKRGPLYMAFTGGNLYVGISSSRDLFEPNVLKPLGMDDLMAHMGNLRQVLGIVDELELNTRVWRE
ncbi:MAG: DUF3137 domain-containing protein [Meiothermus sp.]|nr:DUF3137 domain-containing protein [Meiothermus sp.]